jgi:hypothetical protein
MRATRDVRLSVSLLNLYIHTSVCFLCTCAGTDGRMYTVCVCVHACMHVCMYYVCMYVCTYACMYVCVYVCMDVRMYEYIQAHVFRFNDSVNTSDHTASMCVRAFVSSMHWSSVKHILHRSQSDRSLMRSRKAFVFFDISDKMLHKILKVVSKWKPRRICWEGISGPDGTWRRQLIQHYARGKYPLRKIRSYILTT